MFDQLDSTLFDSLYDGAHVSVCGAYCAIMEFASTFKLPYTTVDGLLKLLLFLCPKSSKLPTSTYMLHKFFKQFSSQPTKTRLCDNYHTSLGDRSTCDDCGLCKNPNVLLHLPIKRAIEAVARGEYACLCGCMQMYACFCE